MWTGEPAPAEYVELTLCREFGCLPSALRAERLVDVINILVMTNAEALVRRKSL